MGREGAGLDYAALFTAVPAACLVLDRELTIVTANDAYLEVTGRTVAELTGRSFFEAFPPDPGEPTSQGGASQRKSLASVLATGRTNMLLMHRVALPGPAGRASSSHAGGT